MQQIEFVIPGDPNTLTGGYIYDRLIADALTAAGWRTNLRAIDADTRTAATQAQAARIFDALPDGSCVLVDGLALAGLADLLTLQRDRLRLAAVMHHPAALETGLEAAVAERIAVDELRALQAMRQTVCTSAWTARRIAATGIAADRICIVEPAVRLHADELDVGAKRRNPLAAHAHGLRLLCVATLTPRKGHDVLIEALAAMADMPWELECIGSADRAPQYAQYLQERIVEQSLAQRIVLRGEVAETELAEAFARSDLFVLASHLEGYGMVLAEARAAALPIVATGGGAVSETLAGAAAVIVDSNDSAALTEALRDIVGDRQRWLDLAGAATEARGRDARQARSWSAAAQELIGHLESAVLQ